MIVERRAHDMKAFVLKIRSPRFATATWGRASGSTLIVFSEHPVFPPKSNPNDWREISGSSQQIGGGIIKEADTAVKRRNLCVLALHHASLHDSTHGGNRRFKPTKKPDQAAGLQILR